MYPPLRVVTLVALQPAWARALFALLSLLLVAGGVDSAVRIRGVAGVTGSVALLLNELVTTVIGVVVVVLPWRSAGPSDEGGARLVDPPRVRRRLPQDGATVMSAFDIARLEGATRGSDGR